MSSSVGIGRAAPATLLGGMAVPTFWRTRSRCDRVGLLAHGIGREALGSWGAGSFDNDDAGDWALELEAAVDLATVRRALAAALEATDYLEVTEGAPGVAAAEVIAALGGLPADDLPEEVRAWVSSQEGSRIGLSDVTMALSALDAVESEDSELQALWSEAGIGEWKLKVDDLRNRLQQLAQVLEHGGAQRPNGHQLKLGGAAPGITSPNASAAVREGDWYAVPLDDGGFARCLVARTSAKEELFLGYVFGPRTEDMAALDGVRELQPQDALLVILVDDFGERPWPLLGRSPGWDRLQWPIPAFGRYEEWEPALRDLRFDYVDDDLDSEPIRTWVPAEEVRRLPREGRMSTRGVEIQLNRLLQRPSE